MEELRKQVLNYHGMTLLICLNPACIHFYGILYAALCKCQANMLSLISTTLGKDIMIYDYSTLYQ
jgi:hypothetical protein